MCSRNADDSASAGPKSALKQNQFGGSFGGPDAEGSRVLLRQLRRLPADAGKELRGSGAERIRLVARVPAIAAPHCSRSSPRGISDRSFRVRRDPDLDIAQLQATQKVNSSRDVSISASTATGRPTRAFSTTRGATTDPQGVSRRAMSMTANPSNAVVNLQRAVWRRHGRTKAEGGLQRRTPTTPGAIGGAGLERVAEPERQRRHQRHRRSGRQLGPRLTGRSGAREQRRQWPGDLPTIPTRLVHRHLEPVDRQPHLMKVGADVRPHSHVDRPAGAASPTTYSERHELPGPTRRRASSIFGDLSEPSPFNGGASA